MLSKGNRTGQDVPIRETTKADCGVPFPPRTGTIADPDGLGPAKSRSPGGSIMPGYARYDAPPPKLDLPGKLNLIMVMIIY
jgi:hypothetical protein